VHLGGDVFKVCVLKSNLQKLLFYMTCKVSLWIKLFFILEYEYKYITYLPSILCIYYKSLLNDIT